MNIEELKIGNLIANEVRILGQKPKIGDIHIVVAEDFTSGWLSFYIPIPLTEEILFKCGFNREGTEAGDDGAMELGEGMNGKGLSLMWVPKKGRYTDKEAIGLWLIRDFGREQLKIDIKRVKYVHQLQNLYMDLYGKKLILNL